MTPSEWLKLLAVSGSVLAMLVGLVLTFRHLKLHDQGLGANSIRAVGVVLFVPTLLILAVVANFEAGSLAALLGTVAGYVLSSSIPEGKSGGRSPPAANASPS